MTVCQHLALNQVLTRGNRESRGWRATPPRKVAVGRTQVRGRAAGQREP